MKKLLLLTTLFLVFACSKDDEGENNEENQTFTQKYDGMGFKNEYGNIGISLMTCILWLMLMV